MKNTKYNMKMAKSQAKKYIEHSAENKEVKKFVYTIEIDSDGSAEKLKELNSAEENTLKMLNETLEQLHALAAMRSMCKMSNSRVTGVAKELRELIKVMSVYAR